MTGLLGGGHAIYLDARERRRPQPRLLRHGAVGQRRADGAPACAVRRGARALRDRRVVVRGPGRARRARRALARHGRLPWPELVEPALRLARDRRRDAGGARRVPGDARPGDDDARRRAHLLAGRASCSAKETCSHQPGLVDALELLRDEGAGPCTPARSATSLLALVAERERIAHRRRPRRRTRRCGREPVEVRVRRAAPAHPRRAVGRAGDARAVRSGGRCRRVARRARATTTAAQATRRTSRSSMRTATRACSRRASGSAPATGYPGSTCT